MSAAEYVEGVQDHHQQGHFVQYSFRVENFAGQLPFDFDRSFTFLCDVSPTSRSFRMAFRKSLDDDSVSCHLFIQRTDHGKNVIEVEFYIKLVAEDPLTDIRSKGVIAREFSQCSRTIQAYEKNRTV